MIQLSIEEDACREISDKGHWRVYTTDRLGMPLIELVTYPDMLTPDEAAEAGQYLRYSTRSTGRVRTGPGAGREDVNVSITGGTRVEIKGVSRITWIPELTHNEAFRQKALLLIRDELIKRIADPKNWKAQAKEIDISRLATVPEAMQSVAREGRVAMAVNLPKCFGLLSFFTQPGRSFSDEISDRLKVIACIDKPNLVTSEDLHSPIQFDDLFFIRKLLGSRDEDAQIIVFGPRDDMKTALEVIEERIQLALLGVPNETRRSRPDGTTMFERVLPGPDRMYPDTDSAPISITQQMIETASSHMPQRIDARLKQLSDWKVPADTHRYLLRRNLVRLVEQIVTEFNQDPVFVGSVFGHTLRKLEGRNHGPNGFRYEQVYDLFKFGKKQKLYDEILKEMLAVLHAHPHMDCESILITLEHKPHTMEQLMVYVPALRKKFQEIRRTRDPRAEIRWIMGNLRKKAIGNVCLEELSQAIERTVGDGR